MPWVTTADAIVRLKSSKSTLYRLRAKRILKEGHHWTRKTPGCPQSDILWHVHRCELALGMVAG